MLRRTVLRVYQAGVHVPVGVAYPAAKMRHWPRQKLPANFNLTAEDKLKMDAIPRDVGRIPRDFVLNVLYHNQPCEVEKIWECCLRDPTVPLDSKRHLRAVLRQSREEGFVCFEKDSSSDTWICLLTRERFQEVRDLAAAVSQRNVPTNLAVLRGSAMAETTANMASYEAMNDEGREVHLASLTRAVEQTNEAVRRYMRTEIDYLPFTDINGKVNFMWWYDVRDSNADAHGSEALATPALQAPNLSGIDK